MSNTTQSKPDEPTQKPQQKLPVLEEDDEFEDFPVEGPSSHPLTHPRIPPTTPANHPPSTTTDWPAEEAEQPSGANGHNAHLWEESWDDDDTAEDFSKQLKCVPSI